MRLIPQDTKVEALRKAPLLQGLTRRELQQLARTSEDVEVEPGKVLCREGEFGSEFFVIFEGKVEVRKGQRGVGTLGPGDFFGEIALVEKSRRTATVTATTPLRFFVLTSRGFWGLLDHNPGVERKVLRTLAKRVLADVD